MTTNFDYFTDCLLRVAHQKDELCSPPHVCFFAEGLLSEPVSALAEANVEAEDEGDYGMQRMRTSAFAASGFTGSVTKSAKVMKGTT